MKLLTAQTYRILEKRAETALIGDLLIILRIDQEIETRKKKSSAAIRNRIIAEDSLYTWAASFNESSNYSSGAYCGRSIGETVAVCVKPSPVLGVRHSTIC